MSYLDTYKSPAACYKKVPVRREYRMEGKIRRAHQLPDIKRFPFAQGGNFMPHEGPPQKLDTPTPREYYEKAHGGKRVHKTKKKSNRARTLWGNWPTSGIGWPD